MQASIVIPTRDRSEVLGETLQCLAGSDLESVDVEVVVVDNGSADETPETVSRWSDRMEVPLRLVHEPGWGLHTARHAGANSSRGEILIYIDDDVSVERGWLTGHLKAYQDMRTVAAGGPVFPLWEVEPPPWIASVPTDYFSLLDYGDKAQPIVLAEGINGCNYSIRKTALEEAGGFHPDSFPDPSLVWYRGDGEAGLTKSLLELGGQVMYSPQASVRHRIPRRRMTKPYLLTRAFAHGIETGYTFARRHGCAYWALAALLVLGFILRAYPTAKLTMAKRDDIRMLLALERFRALHEYARRLFRNPQLRIHVNRLSYYDEGGIPPLPASRLRSIA